MKKLLLILLCLPMILPAQNSTNYKEFNAGILLGKDIGVFPVASFLWGKTIYFNDNTFLDYEGGLSFPKIFTGKIGAGIGNELNAAAVGARLFPPSVYFQLTFFETSLFSIELMPLTIEEGTANGQTTTSTKNIIISYGFRW